MTEIPDDLLKRSQAAKAKVMAELAERQGSPQAQKFERILTEEEMGRRAMQRLQELKDLLNKPL